MSWGEIALLGLRTVAKKLFGWLSAGAVGYEVGKHIDNSDGKISYVNTTIIKSNESTDSNSEVKILLAICNLLGHPNSLRVGDKNIFRGKQVAKRARHRAKGM